MAADEEADELLASAAGDPDRLARLVGRRITGEPLAWVTGGLWWAGEWIRVDPGVYVPRWETAALARRAVELLPADGVAVDLCTGSGAVAAVLTRARPGARVVATDLDPAACRCAVGNGVEVYCGHLADPVPAELRGRVDVVVAVVPYVPEDALAYLPRDVQAFEPRLALDGGPEGIRLLGDAIRAAAELLRPGGTVLLELGAGQDGLVAPVLAEAGFDPPVLHVDEDGDLRGVEAERRS